MIFKQAYADLAISEAEKSFDLGNFPVGAVLYLDDEIIAHGGNYGETTNNYSNHAEAKLIYENGSALLRAHQEGRKISLCSTFEPCLMCLGLAVLNKIDQIIYLEKDPYAGACNLDNKNLSIRYQENWPEITHYFYSEKPKILIINFLKKQIKKGVRVDWSKRYLNIFESK